MSTVGRLSKLVDRKVIPMPNKATIVRVDQVTVDLQISAGSGTIHHVSVQGDISQLTPGMVVPIQWTERDGGYLAPVVIATGNAVVSGVVPSVIVDNQTIQSVDGELQVRPGGIETRHLAFVPSVDGHSHPSELATAGLQTREGILENVAQDFAIRGDGTIDVGGDLFMSGVDPTYRLWAGNEDPASAPFSVEADGTVNGVGGEIIVEETDGVPSVSGVTKIKVSPGTLTDDGGGVVTIQTAAASTLVVEEVDGAPSVQNVTKFKVPNGSLTDDGGGVVTMAIAADDPDAFHDDVGGEINGLAEKTTLHANDLVLIEDSEAGYAKKKAKKSNIVVADDAAIHDNVSGEIAAITEKTAPVGADVVLGEDSQASNAKIKIKLTNVIKKIVPQLVRDVTYYVSPSGNDSNDGSSGSPFLSIQKAVDQFKGFAVDSCVINVAPGRYVEKVLVNGIQSDMFSGLSILGQTDCPINGLAFVHGDSIATLVSDTYEGIGATTLSSDTGGTGGRQRFIATRATISPNFTSAGLAVGSVNDYTKNRVVYQANGEWGYKFIYGASSNALTMDVTGTAPALNANGRYFAVCPNRLIDTPNDVDAVALEVVGCGIYVQGITFNGYYCGARMFHGAIRTKECVFVSDGTPNYYGAVQLGPQSTFFARVDATNDTPVTVLGNWAGISVGFESFANIGNGALVQSRNGFYGVYCTGETYFNNSRCAVGTYTGLYAARSGYIYGAGTAARNWASTPNSPSTSDALGNNNGSITFN